MNKITKRYIFKCKLAGQPVEFNTDELLDKKILILLVNAGIWKEDPLFTKKFWSEYAFTILYPIRMIDDDGKPNLLLEGYHHTVCL